MNDFSDYAIYMRDDFRTYAITEFLSNADFAKTRTNSGSPTYLIHYVGSLFLVSNTLGFRDSSVCFLQNSRSWSTSVLHISGNHHWVLPTVLQFYICFTMISLSFYILNRYANCFVWQFTCLIGFQWFYAVFTCFLNALLWCAWVVLQAYRQWRVNKSFSLLYTN